MKAISNIITAAAATASLLAFAVQPATAQDGGSGIGFIRFVNVVAPGDGNATVRLNGQNPHPQGYTLGQSTGGIGIPEGRHELSVEKSGIESGSTRFDVANGETLTLVAFAERVPPENPDDPPQWRIRILRLQQSDPERGYRASFISLCDLPEVRLTASILADDSTHEILAKRLEITTLDAGRARTEIIVRRSNTDGDILATISPDGPGNHVVILYQDAAAEVRALTFFDPRFVMAN